MYYLDTEDRYSGTAGVAPCLESMGVKAKSGVPAKLAEGRDALLIVGSFVSSPKGKRATNLLASQGPAIRRFVKSGGTLLVLGQRADDDELLTWLPEPLKASRSHRDARRASIRAPGPPVA